MLDFHHDPWRTLTPTPTLTLTLTQVGHMLDFHHDPWLRVLWYTSAPEPAKVREGSS